MLSRLAAENRLIEGEFRPGRVDREWTDDGVLRMVRRRSLARVRQDVEPVEPAVLGRFTTLWQGVTSRRGEVSMRCSTSSNTSRARRFRRRFWRARFLPPGSPITRLAIWTR